MTEIHWQVGFDRLIRAILHIPWPGLEIQVPGSDVIKAAGASSECVLSGAAAPAATSQLSVCVNDGHLMRSSCSVTGIAESASSFGAHHPKSPDQALPRTPPVIIRPRRDKAAFSDSSPKTVSPSHREGELCFVFSLS